MMPKLSEALYFLCKRPSELTRRHISDVDYLRCSDREGGVARGLQYEKKTA